MGTPCRASCPITSRCAWRALRVHAFSCSSVATPPAAATRVASDGFVQNDDPAAAELRGRPVPEQALPACSARRRLVGSRSRTSTSEDERDCEQTDRNRQGALRLSAQSHTHPRRAPRRAAGDRRTAPPTRSSRRCRYRTRAVRRPRRAAPPGARSSPPLHRRRRAGQPFAPRRPDGGDESAQGRSRADTTQPGRRAARRRPRLRGRAPHRGATSSGPRKRSRSPERSPPGTRTRTGRPAAQEHRSRRRPGTAARGAVPPLSNASPAASSSVVPRRSNEPCSRTASTWVWPPVASRHANGGSSGSCRGRARQRGPGGD